MIFRVLEPGLLTTVQAAPRRGWQHMGLSACGPMDLLSHSHANGLLGNPGDAATLEITLLGPRLEILRDVLVALSGADLSATVDGTPLPMNCPVRLAQGSELAFGEARRGCRAYLAVHAGISVPKRMGSRATDLKGHFGGHQGRQLRPGDILYRGAGMDPLPELVLAPGQAFAALLREAVAPSGLDLTQPALLRLIPGAHFQLLERGAQAALLKQSFTVSPKSNRQGLRLSGPPLTLAHSVELLSEGVAFGTLQLPPDGQPILLMADRQSTGGYPRLGEVYTVDLPRAAQLKPGEDLRFAMGSLEEARSLAFADK